MSDEKYLTLADGRTLAYADAADPCGSLVVIFCTVFLASEAPLSHSPPHLLRRKRTILPPCPQGGISPPFLTDALTSHMTEFISHLHPNTADLRIYISGGSQKHSQVSDCRTVLPRSNTTKNTQFHNMAKLHLRRPTYTHAPLPATSAHRQLLFDHAPPEERAAFAQWREKQSLGEGALERPMATGVVKSISKSWAGFIEVADVLHSDWGFRPDQLDDEHANGRPMLVAASVEDDLGPHVANWLRENYKNSELQWLPGKHLSTLYEIDRQPVGPDVGDGSLNSARGL
ncbi:AB hydrolase-1 domain-containing protein [Mycena venus]|uniref:AB hydrolase-1 domain-containing protein n=1 Tax=Mycena venus TaxID=2733690 RepID=A0A8H6YC26_9AGAR|nr:AB hydrolase-1 domain-containing protein [Mycena venus]